MESKIAKFYEKVIGAIESGTVTNKEQLGKYKLKAGKQIGIATLPSNPNILMHAKTPSEQMVQLLSIKPLRTLSGVAPVAIMTKPISCPHGTCIYCPGGLKVYLALCHNHIPGTNLLLCAQFQITTIHTSRQ